MNAKRWLWGAAAALSILMVGQAWPARESNIRQTKHNLSSSGLFSVKATTETQVCVFCHTPHAASAGVTPLWNRKLSSATYTPYTSSSLDAQAIEGSLGQPGGSSKLCLSCHDGTLAIGNVNVLNGAGSATTTGTQSITMTGTGVGGVMAPGSGNTTGFTRFLDTDLTNDHPISVTYNKALVDRDGELRTATLGTDATWEIVSGGTRIAGVRNFRSQGGGGQPQKPLLPLEKTGAASDAGQVQCATCHDPHIRETDASKGNQKFLRLNRFQEGTPTGTYSQDNDIICLSCHDKNQGNFGTWAYSAHANPLVATQTYTVAGANQREFPASQPVWKAACLNCHDTHTIPGARRLLREGTDGGGTPKAGGSSAIEETCYQCHSSAAGNVVTPLTTVPNIKDDFTLSTRRMPITSSAQLAGVEKHDIGGNFSDPTFVDCSGTTNKCGKDFIEQRTLLGAGAGGLNNRHAECTDCHNPHRVVKFKDFRGVAASGSLAGTPDASGTHPHTDNNVAIHSNIASGVLRGTWGVEPTSYASASFHALPTSYTVKRGDPGSSTNTAAAAGHVTREYQICLKCHSDYAYSDDNVYPNSNSRPQLGGTNLTPANANGHSNFSSYTNQAKEFQAPAGHNVPVGSVSLGNNGGTGTAASNANNHRSWHPVMAPTGRTGRSGSWIAPWNNSGTGGLAGRLGVQTMYCSDCHGSDTGATASVIPTGGENGSPWGPHGSTNNFLLKGDWSTGSGEGNSSTLCFKCHSQSAYSGGGGTGFSTDRGDGHSVHSDKIDSPLRCNWCHVAVPHGWKNRNLLVNLLDVGAEAGLAPGTAVTFTNNQGYTNGPYYRKAFLRVISFPSGQWRESNCNGGSKDTMKSNCENPN